MYISDTNDEKPAEKTAYLYLLASIGCAVFGAVYELFSHEVYSFYMLYAFMFPLVGGAFLFLTIRQFSKKKTLGAVYHCGIATLTVGSMIRGVLEIYGTSNDLTHWYWITGGCLCFAGILRCIMKSETS